MRLVRAPPVSTDNPWRMNTCSDSLQAQSFTDFLGGSRVLSAMIAGVMILENSGKKNTEDFSSVVYILQSSDYKVNRKKFFRDKAKY